MYHLRIILVIILFILLIFFFSKKENFDLSQIRKWWNVTTTTGGVQGADRNTIHNSLGRICPENTNQYVESGKKDMEHSCYLTNNEFSKINRVVNFNENGPFSQEYDKMENVKILKNVTQYHLIE